MISRTYTTVMGRRGKSEAGRNFLQPRTILLVDLSRVLTNWVIVDTLSPQVEGYVRELNSLEARRGRKPLDVNNVIYWFKNTRAAVKRTEMKTRALQGRSRTTSRCDALTWTFNRPLLQFLSLPMQCNFLILIFNLITGVGKLGPQDSSGVIFLCF